MHLPTLLSVVAAMSHGISGAALPAVSATPVTTLSIPVGTVVGSVVQDVEYYRGIPYAEAPTGSLRLRPPVRKSAIGTVQATGVGPSCPQMTNVAQNFLIGEVASIPDVAAALSILTPAPNPTEDCLTISVMRPKGTAANASLPVLFWIFGGGYEIGSPANYNGSVLIPQSVAQGQPMILVTINYRVGGFGFLPGAEVLADGSTNLGLLDQKMGLEWVADNIAAFGGDPNRVTIWGESAGSYSVFNQMALYDGNNTYNGRPLFRAGIMNSGSIYPTEPVDSPKAQAIFDTVAQSAGCSSSPNKLACLRNLDYEAYWNATNSVPSPFSYHSPVSSFLVRPDGRTITASTEVLAQKGLFAKVPIIIGDQEDEGTFLSLTQTNLTTRADLISFLKEVMFHNATLAELEGLVNTYPSDAASGSPFRTGSSNEPYPVYKQLAAMLGDLTFTMLRRLLLESIPSSSGMSAWSYLATYGYGTPLMGTFHTADLPRLFYGTDDVSVSMQSRYIAFVDSMDPNRGSAAFPAGFETHWPTWHEGRGKGRQLIEFGANSTKLITDDFRDASYRYIKDHASVLRI